MIINTLKKLAITLPIFLVGAGYASAQQKIDISVHQQAPAKKDTILPGIILPVVAGTTIHFDYIPKGNLKSTENINGLAYIFADYQWSLHDVEMQQNGAQWKVSFNVPRDAAFIAFKFYTQTDNGIVADTNQDMGYMYTTVYTSHQEMPGSSLAWGTFRNKNFNMEFENYFKDFSISDEATEYWVKKEIQDFPKNFPKFIKTYIRTLKLRKPDNYVEIGNKLMDQFLKDYPNLTEEQLTNVQQIYAYDLKNSDKADSLKTVLQQKYPTGILNRADAFLKSNSIQNSQEKIEAFSGFLTDFPENKDVPKSQQYFYNKAYNALFENYFVKKEYDSLLPLIPKMDFASLNDAYHFTISKAYYFKSETTPKLLDLSINVIGEMRKKIGDQSYANGLFWSPNQATDNAQSQFDRKLKVQIKMLVELKKYDEALKEIYWLSEKDLYNDSSFNALHVNVLQQLNKNPENVLTEAARNNALTSELEQLLKKNYVASGHSEAEFQKYFQQLKSGDQKTSEISKDIISIDAPNLVFEDQKGTTVELPKSSKIIILDFWANWCAPCKKSFPAMKTIVDQYSNDKDVEFYFVNTQEAGKDYKAKTEVYIKNNNLNLLNILFDKKEAGKNSNILTFSKFSKLFNSSGIPRKVIIKDGKIRYTSEGYSGNPGELSDEIHSVIKILKAEH